MRDFQGIVDVKDGWMSSRIKKRMTRTSNHKDKSRTVRMRRRDDAIKHLSKDSACENENASRDGNPLKQLQWHLEDKAHVGGRAIWRAMGI